MGLVRLLLAVSVLIAHSGSIFGIKLVGGMVAVQAFFICSGFYMSLILNEKYIEENGSFKLFITNRLLRLYPIYWSILLLTLCYSLLSGYLTNGLDFGPLQSYNTYLNDLSISAWLYLFFSNGFLFFQDFAMFLGFSLESSTFFFTSNFQLTNPKVYSFLLVPQAWTLGLELMFYLIAPFILRKSLFFILSIIAASFLLRISFYSLGMKFDPWTYRFFPFELSYFLLGNVSYRIFQKIKFIERSSLFDLFILFSTVSFIICFDLFEFRFKIYFFYLHFILALPFIFRLTMSWKFDRYIGDLSYPTYLSHILVFSIVGDMNLLLFGEIGMTTFCATIVFSGILNEAISKKTEMIRQRRLVNLQPKAQR